METNLTIVAPEGVYSLTEEHKPQILQLSSTAPSPYPTRLSTVTIKYAVKPGGQGLSGLLGRQDRAKDKVEPDRVSASSSDNGNDDAAGSNDSSGDIPRTTHAFSGPSLFATHVPQGAKRKTASRPRHNMKTTSSAFVTRHQTAEGLNRTLASKQGDVTYVFFNHGKSVFWSEAGIRAKDPLARITFSAYPTCHDINMETVAPDRLDVVIGFNTGDLVWFDAISSRYVRLNKQGCITSSPCTSVRWVPRSPVLFLVSHADGTVLVYDKEREDGTFTPRDPDASLPGSLPLTKDASTISHHLNGTSHNLEPGTGASSQTSSILPGSTAASEPQQWDPLDDLLVTRPPWHPTVIASGAERDSRKVVVKNPLSHWRVSRRAVLSIVFSPDVQYVAVACDDGCLRIIDALNERLMDTYASYFGAFTCVDWSPDGRFVLTGGQDDLVTVISPWDQRIVARCQGHSSFISAVAFDPHRCDGRTYRFGSVGEDSKLILWDFSSGALHRPKMSLSHHQRMSLSSTLSLVRRHPIGADPSTLQLQLPQNGEAGPVRRFHPAPGRSDVAVVQPVLIKQVEGEILTSVAFLATSMLTASKAGLVKVWVRPLAVNKPQRAPRQR